jgi:hypothetical protein
MKSEVLGPGNAPFPCANVVCSRLMDAAPEITSCPCVAEDVCSPRRKCGLTGIPLRLPHLGCLEPGEQKPVPPWPE